MFPGEIVKVTLNTLTAFYHLLIQQSYKPTLVNVLPPSFTNGRHRSQYPQSYHPKKYQVNVFNRSLCSLPNVRKPHNPIIYLHVVQAFRSLHQNIHYTNILRSLLHICLRIQNPVHHIYHHLHRSHILT